MELLITLGSQLQGKSPNSSSSGFPPVITCSFGRQLGRLTERTPEAYRLNKVGLPFRRHRTIAESAPAFAGSQVPPSFVAISINNSLHRPFTNHYPTTSQHHHKTRWLLVLRATTSCIAVAGTFAPALVNSLLPKTYRLANQKDHFSLGATLTDTLDDLITDHRIDPQLAMKILANFDRAIADVLQEKVKARLTFKVRSSFLEARASRGRERERTS